MRRTLMLSPPSSSLELSVLIGADVGFRRVELRVTQRRPSDIEEHCEMTMFSKSKFHVYVIETLTQLEKLNFSY